MSNVLEAPPSGLIPTYIVRPQLSGGYILTGPLLPNPLCYRNESDAASYGLHLCREKGGRVVILDAEGRWQFTEHAASEGSGLRILNEYRTGGS